MRLAWSGLTLLFLMGALTGCIHGGDGEFGGVVPPSTRRIESIQTRSGFDVGAAPGWRVREESSDSIWLLSSADDSEMIVTRKGGPWPDFTTLAGQEADLIRTQAVPVAGPIETQLFGEPAASFSSSGPEYSRIEIVSAACKVSVHRQGPFDQEWASAVGAMLATAHEAPDIPSPK